MHRLSGLSDPASPVRPARTRPGAEEAGEGAGTLSASGPLSLQTPVTHGPRSGRVLGLAPALEALRAAPVLLRRRV